MGRLNLVDRALGWLVLGWVRLRFCGRRSQLSIEPVGFVSLAVAVNGAVLIWDLARMDILTIRASMRPATVLISQEMAGAASRWQRTGILRGVLLLIGPKPLFFVALLVVNMGEPVSAQAVIEPAKSAPTTAKPGTPMRSPMCRALRRPVWSSI